MMRIGHGYDIHAFDDASQGLALGGIEIPHTRGVKAHSDGDVILHALIDALLGAAGLGDIGLLFPDTDQRWLDAPSSEMLHRVLEDVQAAGWVVVNTDITVIAQEPKLSPHREAICTSVAALLSLQVSCVNIKATTHEGLGTLGRAEGIAAHAVVLLEGAPSP